MKFSISKLWCKIMGQREEGFEVGVGISNELRIVEHEASMWSYHLAIDGKYTSVCANTDIMMNTYMSMDQWGCMKGNQDINYKWCKDCSKILKEAK